MPSHVAFLATNSEFGPHAPHYFLIAGSRAVKIKKYAFSEEIMIILRSAMTAALFAMSIAGCQKASDPPKPVASGDTSKSAGNSVAMPSTALPPSDSAIAPATPNATTADAGKTSQANPKELDKQQESTSMPMPGQVNNHSTPAPLEKK
jgi:hypothetical protein